MPPRRGSLFNPHEYSFLEGWGPAGSAPITQPEDRAEVKLPSLDDETVFRILERLLMFEGQRLSYRALDVEQIGSVYEALMGYHVIRTEAPAVCMRPDRLWVTADEVLAVPPTRRAKWIKETIGLSVAQADKLNEEVSELSGDAALEALAKFAVGRRTELAFSRAKLGQLVLQPGTERRRTSSHYTPRSLSAPIVRRTLEPLLAVMGDAPASERILRLKICDPAMGSGAFLVEACRFLADHVLAAWTREGKVAEIAGAHGDPLLHARRLVAQRCLYGVDKNDAAVELAKLSLWLVTLSKTLPFTFLDHSLRHGDSLVGLDFDQLRAFHWKRPEETKAPAKQLELFGREIAMALDEAIALRQRIGDLGDSADDDREKARLLWDAEDALDRVRLIGDVIVGAFFAHEKDKERERERARREDLVRAWLGTGGPPTEELREMQRELRTRVPVFHWMVEYPEVFYADRPDPLENEYLNRAAYVDGCVVNPPFLSGTRISTALGDRYLSWLLASHPSTHGNADLVVHFLLLGHALLGRHGTLGLVATNTIAQGDSRSSGLAYLLALGAEIYEAWSAREWPGEASVMYCVVHLAVGNARVGQFILDGVRVESLNSSLLPMRERSEPHPLRSMSGLASKGVDTGGEGFVLDRREREALCATDSRNHERIHPYVGGQELNTSPSFDHERWVVNFTGMTLQEAAQFPSLLALVDERVRRPRQALRSTPVNDRLKETWWLYWAPREDFMRDLHSLQRFMAATVYTKHFAISFQRPGRVFNSKVLLIALDGNSHFAVLQSRIHECWARRSSSTLGVGDTLSYSLSDAFVTFPFPHNEPRTPVQSLESIGGCLYGSRANYMEEENVGLTITYNRLKDPTCTEARVLELRALHEEMDRAVTAAYAENDPDGRWSEIEVPPYCPLTHADNRKLEAFENAVIDRLFALNAKRAEDEKLKGLGSRSSKQKKRVTTSEGQPANKAAASPKGAPTSKQLKITDTSES